MRLNYDNFPPCFALITDCAMEAQAKLSSRVKLISKGTTDFGLRGRNWQKFGILGPPSLGRQQQPEQGLNFDQVLTS